MSSPSYARDVLVDPYPLGVMATGQVVVGSSSAALIGSGTITARRSLVLVNQGTIAIFIGGSGVTATTGIEIAPGASWSDDKIGPIAIYAITATGSSTVGYQELA